MPNPCVSVAVQNQFNPETTFDINPALELLHHVVFGCYHVSEVGAVSVLMVDCYIMEIVINAYLHPLFMALICSTDKTDRRSTWLATSHRRKIGITEQEFLEESIL
jgi:hypothetical protein